MLRLALSDAIGVRAFVRKTRELLMRRNIRLHLDRVEGLGEFGEVEAVLGPADSNEAFQAEVNAVLEVLGVGRSDLIDLSYFELLGPAVRSQI
jgi:predicted adenylyl cyclase CyaB